MKTTTTAELLVVEVFRFQDGRTVFAGPIYGEAKYIPACRAELLIDGNAVAEIGLEGEMISNSVHPKGYRSVSTTDAVDLQLDRLKDMDVRLRLDAHPCKI
jgi:hypothetical protein